MKIYTVIIHSKSPDGEDSYDYMVVEAPTGRKAAEYAADNARLIDATDTHTAFIAIRCDVSEQIAYLKPVR